MLESQYQRHCDPPPPPECLRWGEFLGWRADNLINATYLGNAVVARYYGTAEPYVGERLPIAYKNGIYTMWGRNVVVEPEEGGSRVECCVKILSYITRFENGTQVTDFYLGGDRKPQLVASISDPYTLANSLSKIPAGFRRNNRSGIYVPSLSPTSGTSNNPPLRFLTTEIIGLGDIGNTGMVSCSCKKSDWCISYLAFLSVNPSPPPPIYGIYDRVIEITAFFITPSGVKSYEFTPRPGASFVRIGSYGSAILLKDRMLPTGPEPLPDSQPTPGDFIDEQITSYAKNGNIISQYNKSYIFNGINDQWALIDNESVYQYDTPPIYLDNLDPVPDPNGTDGVSTYRQFVFMLDGKGNELTGMGEPFATLSYSAIFPFFGLPVGFLQANNDGTPLFNLVGNKVYGYSPSSGDLYCYSFNGPTGPRLMLKQNGNDWSQPAFEDWTIKKCNPKINPSENIPPGTIVAYKAVQDRVFF